MSDRLPVSSGKKLMKFLRLHDFVLDRRQGSHCIMIKIVGGYEISVTVPDHLRVGTLLDILKEAGISREEYIRYCRKGKRGKN